MILVVNVGSSSLRLAAYRAGRNPELLAADRVDTPAGADPEVCADFLRRHGLGEIRSVIHRVVHGGERFRGPIRIDAGVEAEIERLGVLAPLHNPVSLAWIRAVRRVLPAGTPELAAFDTAFYADLPDTAAAYALPEDVARRHGLRRYGFHGLAHQSMHESWRAAGGDPDARIVSVQLGSGCSMTACRGGRPLDTSMGFSPLEGLVMATRSGDIDPAAVVYLLEHGGFTPSSVLELLNRRSGLLGVSGLSSNVSELTASDAAPARRAVALFCHRLRRYLGGYLAVLGGADAVLIGGGIGENSPEIRARALEGFEWAGLHLDPGANAGLPPAGGPIHVPDSGAALLVTPVDEMRVMARSAWALLNAGA